jgi:phosphoribosylformylglycinamidine (FGAM) synthase PurS component
VPEMCERLLANPLIEEYEILTDQTEQMRSAAA